MTWEKGDIRSNLDSGDFNSGGPQEKYTAQENTAMGV